MYQTSLPHLECVLLYACHYYSVQSYSSLLNLHYFHRDLMEIQRVYLYLFCSCFAVQRIHKYLTSSKEFLMHKELSVSFWKQLPHGIADICRQISILTAHSLQNANRESINTIYQNSLEVCQIVYTTWMCMEDDSTVYNGGRK